MAISIGTLLAIASTVASYAGKISDEDSAAAYQEKIDAWTRERDRIAEANRVKKERHSRRAALMNVIDSDVKFMRPKMEHVPGTSEANIDKPDTSNWTELGNALGTFGSMASASPAMSQTLNAPLGAGGSTLQPTGGSLYEPTLGTVSRNYDTYDFDKRGPSYKPYLTK